MAGGLARGGEISAFVLLAVALHLALLLRLEPEGAAMGEGQAGSGTVLVQGASAEMQALVEAWQKPPPAPPELPADNPQPPAVVPSPVLQPAAEPRPVPRPKPAEPAPPPRQAAARASEEAAPAAAEASGSGAAAAQATAAGHAGTAVLSERERQSLLLSWGASIRAEVERHRRYPQTARLRGTEGVATLRLTVEHGGRLASAAVASSAGAARLDQAALEAARAASPFPPADPRLEGEAFTFDLPVAFQLTRR